MEFSFTVFGVPQSQGSTRAFIPKGWKRPIITSTNKNLKPWRQQVAGAALDAMARACEGDVTPISREIPVAVRLDFYLARPQSLPKKFTRPTKRPDADKLFRAVADALTGTVITDDSQIVEALVSKWYGQPERVEIHVSTFAEGVPKTPRIQRPQLFENAQPVGSEIGLPKTDVIGQVG